MEYEEILIGLRPMIGWNDFAASLLAQYDRKGDLSERQWDAAERMILKTQATAQRKEDLQRDVDVSRIKNLLVEAKVKKPVFRAAELAFSLASVSGKNAGAVYVKRGADYQGKIMSGKFMPVGSCHDLTGDAVVQVSADPRGQAVQHGRDTGRCSCCGRELTDPFSIEQGIGPICASNWSL
tara:strand:+ start:1457 stop:1999 length:543 start_codon:yes stop_codon:yes gene_type:complete